MIVVQNVAKAKTVNIPILTDYPVKDPTKVGQRFWYQGNEWHYLTQPEIDALGWPETAGFPAPVSKSLYYSNSILQNNYEIVAFGSFIAKSDSIFDVIGFGNIVSKLKSFSFNGMNIATPKNFHLLISLQDRGTQLALNINSSDATKTILDAIFTQLPATTKVATIDIHYCPEGHFSNHGVATAKGYIVIT